MSSAKRISYFKNNNTFLFSYLSARQNVRVVAEGLNKQKLYDIAYIYRIT